MSDRIGYYFQIASTFSVLLPIIFGMLRWREHDALIKWFIIFLVIGFLNDLAGWIFYMTKNFEANGYARHAYDLFEAVFLFWFLSRLLTNPLPQKLLSIASIVLFLFWLTRFFFDWGMSVFKTSTEVGIAFFACFLILRKVEASDQIWRQVSFWLLLGIFFYCFTTYFFMGLLGTKLQAIWYSHALFNIATNLIYMIGFVRSRQPQLS